MVSMKNIIAFQTLKEKPIPHNKIINGELQDFVLDYIPDDSVNIESQTFTIKGKKMFKYDPSLIFNVSDEQIKYVLNCLPSSYLDVDIKWLSITNVLKGLNKKIIWEQWSMQSSSYNEFQNNKIWRGIKDIIFDLNYFVNVVNLTLSGREAFNVPYMGF